MTTLSYTQKLGIFLCSLSLSALPATTLADSLAGSGKLDIPVFALGLGSDFLDDIFEDTSVDPAYYRLEESLKESLASAEKPQARKAAVRKIPSAKKAARARTHSLQKTQTVVATAYSSTPDQTDASPCITANGFNVCKNNAENVIAANFLPFGTRVRLPELYGGRVFTVHDRMNARYGDGRIDLWMKSRTSAKQFGVKRTTMEVVADEIAIAL